MDSPLSLYAATKRADQLMSETYAHLYRIPQTGLRFFTVYGPWGRPDIAMWLFTDAILENRPITVFNGGRMVRNFTYIDDIVSGMIAALDNPPSDDGEEKAGGSLSPHRLYNIGNNRPEELETLITTIEEALGLLITCNLFASTGGLCDEAQDDGRGDRIRTCDPLVPNQVRYQPAPLPDSAAVRETWRDTQASCHDNARMLQ